MCIYQKIRSKKYTKYIYCTKKKKEITYNTCRNCKDKLHKKTELIQKSKIRIKKKSNRLVKLEKQRDKSISKEGICVYCGKYGNRLDSHEVYGGSNRQRSILNGFVKKLCRECHSNEEILQQLKINAQKEYEKIIQEPSL